LFELQQGENLGRTGWDLDDYMAMDTAVNGWYNEVENYDWKNPGQSKKGGMVGHFTQMVWKTHTHVGYGLSQCVNDSRIILVARYSPWGNIIGQYGANVLPAGNNAGTIAENNIEKAKDSDNAIVVDEDKKDVTISPYFAQMIRFFVSVFKDF